MNTAKKYINAPLNKSQIFRGEKMTANQETNIKRQKEPYAGSKAKQILFTESLKIQHSPITVAILKKTIGILGAN